MFKYENDSRKVTKGQTFVAIKGLTVDGHDFIDKAIANGASEIICEKDLDIDVPYIKVKDTSKYLKETLSKEYKNVLDDLCIIGVTGTNGKTTSCYLMYQMLIECGIDAAYIGTLGFYHKDEFIELNNTTPDILVVYKLIVEAHEKGCKVVVMEVSSQALSYDRLYGIKYSLIGFTNLTEDHLDYHKTMENYLNAKLMILDHLTKDAKIIVNADDEKGSCFKKEGHEYYTFGFNGDYKILEYDIDPSEINLTFEYKKKYNVTIPLTSKFNIYNYLTMLSILNQYGISIDELIKNTSKLSAPKGRCETYKVNGGFAIIDYAHTPDAVEKVIDAYTELKKSRVITIIGCGGDRDAKKRPIMGNIATSKSDYTIFTNDNPRTEDPELIMKDILGGVKTKDNYEVILDRKEAIKHGIDIMKKGDILLILGKGHENYQIIGKEKHHLDDAEEVLNYK